MISARQQNAVGLDFYRRHVPAWNSLYESVRRSRICGFDINFDKAAVCGEAAHSQCRRHGETKPKVLSAAVPLKDEAYLKPPYFPPIFPLAG